MVVAVRFHMIYWIGRMNARKLDGRAERANFIRGEEAY